MSQLYSLLIHRPDPSRKPRVMLSLARNPLKDVASKPHLEAHFMLNSDTIDAYYWGVPVEQQELVEYATKFVNWLATRPAYRGYKQS